MVILKLLSEEVFDFSSGQITQVKAKHLKDRQVIALEFLSNFSNNFKKLEVDYKYLRNKLIHFKFFFTSNLNNA